MGNPAILPSNPENRQAYEAAIHARSPLEPALVGVTKDMPRDYTEFTTPGQLRAGWDSDRRAIKIEAMLNRGVNPAVQGYGDTSNFEWVSPNIVLYYDTSKQHVALLAAVSPEGGLAANDRRTMENLIGPEVADALSGLFDSPETTAAVEIGLTPSSANAMYAGVKALDSVLYLREYGNLSSEQAKAAGVDIRLSPRKVTEAVAAVNTLHTLGMETPAAEAAIALQNSGLVTWTRTPDTFQPSNPTVAPDTLA